MIKLISVLNAIANLYNLHVIGFYDPKYDETVIVLMDTKTDKKLELFSSKSARFLYHTAMTHIRFQAQIQQRLQPVFPQAQ